MIFIKIIVDLICGALNAWGGFSWHNARRYLMPVVLGITVSVLTHIWWLGLLILPVIGTLCLGYFHFGNFGRGLWLFLQSFVIGAGLLLTGHLVWYFYIPYCIISGILGGLLVKLYQPIGDAIEGCWLGIIVFLVR